MKFIDHLSKNEIRKVNQLRKTMKDDCDIQDCINVDKTPKTKVKESFSYRELEELMGTRKDIFIRVRGAVRRK